MLLGNTRIRFNWIELNRIQKVDISVSEKSEI